MFKSFIVSFLFLATSQAFSLPMLNFDPYPYSSPVVPHHHPPVVPHTVPPTPHYHPPIVVPQYVIPPVPICSIYQGSSCHTYTGNVCPLLAPYHQPLWLNSCLDIDDVFHLCVTTPNLAPPVQELRPICALQGSPCFCSFGLWNGYPAYEHGQVF